MYYPSHSCFSARIFRHRTLLCRLCRNSFQELDECVCKFYVRFLAYYWHGWIKGEVHLPTDRDATYWVKAPQPGVGGCKVHLFHFILSVLFLCLLKNMAVNIRAFCHQTIGSRGHLTYLYEFPFSLAFTADCLLSGVHAHVCNSGTVGPTMAIRGPRLLFNQLIQFAD